MSAPQPTPRFCAQAQTSASAWFGTFLRAVRSGDAAAVALAKRELRALGVEVRAIPPEIRL